MALGLSQGRMFQIVRITKGSRQTPGWLAFAAGVWLVPETGGSRCRMHILPAVRPWKLGGPVCYEQIGLTIVAATMVALGIA